ncbi:nicotinamidase-related amidase [Clostridium punense]|uniref:Nicotinamidase-related amidase n=1 Tax=Clostridium punense TaxID=1054297 RepID=A0ABS4K815_9CLOT|nr:hypothetical protein M918_23030 [Clostridium sp. BL8]MBP2023939.1 nicotinamidase-related amidase [Clostridium punense]
MNIALLIIDVQEAFIGHRKEETLEQPCFSTESLLVMKVV